MFNIYGPYKLIKKGIKIPHTNLSISYIDKEKSLVTLQNHIGQKIGGVYVFAMRRQRHSGTAWYIGKNETKSNLSLVNEAFSSDKLKKYARALSEESGTPIMFILSPSDSRSDNIDSLEEFLIWLARQSNPTLINKQKVRLSPNELSKHLTKHKIKGMLGRGTGRGRATDSEKSFRAMMGWNKIMHLH